MLGFMRKHARSTFIKVVFLMIIVVFVFWGVGVMVGGGDRVNVAAMVDGQPIGVQEYQRAYENIHRVYQQLYRENFNPQMIAQLNLEQRALDDLIDDLLLKREAAKLGLQVSDDEVRDAILNVPTFRDGARFDRGRYLAALRASRLSPTEFEESQRESLLITKLESLLTDGLYVSDREVHDLFLLENETVNVAFVKVPFAKFEDATQVGDDELKAFYESNQERFRIPDKVTITYVSYDPEKIGRNIEVTDDSIQAYYESHDSEFEAPGKVRLRHVLFVLPPDADDAAKAAIRAKADGVLGEARGGADFSALARQHSEDPLSKEDGGDLGFVERGKLEPALEEAAFGGEAGAIPDVVQTSRGFHVLKIEEVHPESVKPLAEVRDEIVRALQDRGAEEAAEKALEQDLERAQGGTTLEELASARGLEAITPPPIARGAPVPGVVGTQLAPTAFTLDAGAVEQIAGIEPPYYLLKVNEKTPSAITPFDEARPRIEETLRNEAAKKAARAEAEALFAKTNGSVAALDDVARAAGYMVEETGPFGRNEPIPKLGSAPIRESLFALTPEAPFDKVRSLSDAAVVIALRERVLPDESTFAEKRDALRDGALSRKRVQILESYRNALRQRADISVNPDIITKARI